MSARRQRFAHCAESAKSQTQKRTIFLSHASLLRNFPHGFREEILRRRILQSPGALPAAKPRRQNHIPKTLEFHRVRR